jgi:hypothetical protein
LDEHQGIVIYPSRAKLFRVVLGECLAMAVFAALLVAFWSGAARDVRMYLLFVPMLVLFLWVGVATLFTAYRTIVRKPAVMVDELGVTDTCSFIAGGVGLIWWHEIEAIFPYIYNPGSRARRLYLVIMPTDAHAVMTRRGPLLRFLMRVFTLTLPARTSLPEWMLSISVEELTSQIRSRYEKHLQANHVYLPAQDLVAEMARRRSSPRAVARGGDRS